ncbi:uncharacterized protein L201_000109 [Kwoniella dendrophila CBS 6074]|uniref:Uncharacterized protein n=1 Tax=Kwoniella dendrophila CBS 6074 TaxID=1295534 RepID=A0AAX4JIE1_9TREE
MPISIRTRDHSNGSGLLAIEGIFDTKYGSPDTLAGSEVGTSSVYKIIDTLNSATDRSCRVTKVLPDRLLITDTEGKNERLTLPQENALWIASFDKNGQPGATLYRKYSYADFDDENEAESSSSSKLSNLKNRIFKSKNAKTEETYTLLSCRGETDLSEIRFSSKPSNSSDNTKSQVTPLTDLKDIQQGSLASTENPNGSSANYTFDRSPKQSYKVSKIDNVLAITPNPGSQLLDSSKVRLLQGAAQTSEGRHGGNWKSTTDPSSNGDSVHFEPNEASTTA